MIKKLSRTFDPIWIVDCIKFVGDLILSKSTTNTISLWKSQIPLAEFTPSLSEQRGLQCSSITHLRDFNIRKCDIWFIKFEVDASCSLLAIGNCVGDIRVWDIAGATNRHFCTLSNPLCYATIRKVSFSPDGNCLIAVCDDGTVWKWDAQP